MKKVRITLGTTEVGTYCKPHSPLPALLWAEIIAALHDYSKFERREKGTRFDKFL